MTLSIRPVWSERMVCRRCGEEFCPVSGAIPGFVEMREGTAPVQKVDPDADQPLGFAVFDGKKPVCLDCAGLLPGGGVDLSSMLVEFQVRWVEEYARLLRACRIRK